MSEATDNLIGAAWLARQYGLDLVQALATTSRIGGRRSTEVVDGRSTETYVEAMRPAADLRGHLAFHLKHEVPHFELLSRLFAKCNPAEIVAWIHDEPTGQYARRAGFLYEWFTGARLPLDPATPASYVDAVDDSKVVVASRDRVAPNRRWRVRDNMPGTPAFCPLVRKDALSRPALQLDVPALLAELKQEFGEELLMKSAVWMTLRESRASFEIEGEADETDRVQRFASVLARRTGQGGLPLTDADLAELQSEILGRRSTLREFGLRKSPVFVGEFLRYQEVVHYVAPPAQDLPAMLDGLLVFLARTQGQSAVMRCAVAAFGFVYIHPLADGNGRVHRFLVNDVLRRDGAVQEPIILPVSSLIMSDAGERRAYDRILEVISAPLMQAVAGQYQFGERIQYPDGITSNLQFHADDKARPVWRLPDLTRHVAYLAGVLERTIREDMREESRYMRSHAQARAAIKDILEMPDAQADRIIRSVEANQGTLTNSLAREIPALAEESVWEEVLEALRRAFHDGPDGDAVSKYGASKRAA